MSIDNSIFLFEDFEQQSSERVVREIFDLTEKGFKNIDIYINSYGGYVSDLNAMTSAMNNSRNQGVEFSTIAIGMAASCGAMLFLSGDKGKRLVGSNAEIFTHSVQNMEWGGEKQFEEALAKIKSENDTFANIISSQTNMSYEDARLFIKEDTSMNADKAIELGLADAVWDAKELEQAIEQYQLVASAKQPSMKMLEAKRFIHNYKKLNNPKENAMANEMQAKVDDLTTQLEAYKAKETDLQNKLNDAVKRENDLKAKYDEFVAKVEQEKIDRKKAKIEEVKKVSLADKATEIDEMLNASLHLDEVQFEKVAKAALKLYVKPQAVAGSIESEEFVKDEDKEEDDPELVAEFKQTTETDPLQAIMYHGNKKK